MNVVLCQETKGTGRQTNDTGRRTKGIEGNRNELNAVHIQLCSLNSIEYEIGFRLEGFFFSVSFFIIHLLRKLSRLHLRSYGR